MTPKGSWATSTTRYSAPYLNRFLTEDVDVRRMKYTPAKVWERHFSHGALVELCEAKQRGGTGLLDKLWSMTQPRTPDLKRYVVYISRSRLVFKDWSAYETFLAEFERTVAGATCTCSASRCRTRTATSRSRCGASGRAPITPVPRTTSIIALYHTTSQATVKKCKSSIYQSAHCAVQKTEGAFWRTCPVLDQPLFEVRIAYNYGTSERRRGAGPGSRSRGNSGDHAKHAGRVIWNKQIGANQQFMFHPALPLRAPGGRREGVGRWRALHVPGRVLLARQRR